MASVTLSGVTKAYPGGVQAVRDVDLSIDDGELVVIAGPSGCGKTTTLRLIAGLEEPTAGEIHIGPRLVNRVSPAERNVAMVFQNYALYPHQTVAQNMAFGLKMSGTPKIEIQRRVTEAAKLLGIEALLARRPNELSGGQQQRVAVGRAMVREPNVFLFDEPLSNLDASLRGDLRAELAALHQRLAATMLYVTHDQVEAMTLGDRLVLVRDGQVQQIGPPAEVYQEPANQFVATFLGSPGMNLLRGTMQAGVFRTPDGEATWKLHHAHQGPVVLGIRPEDLLVAQDEEPEFASLRPHRIEHLGHETLVHFRLAAELLIARMPANRPIRGDQPMRLTIRQGAERLFEDKLSGCAIA